MGEGMASMEGGELLTKGVDTYYVDFQKLLSFLSAQEFSGYLSLRFDKEEEYKVLFMDGKPIMTVSERGKEGGVAKELIERVSSENGKMDIFKLDQEEIIESLLPFIEELKAPIELETRYLKVKEFLKDLTEKKYNGFLYFLSKDGRGLIFFSEGDVLAAVYSNKEREWGETALSRAENAEKFKLVKFEEITIPEIKEKPKVIEREVAAVEEAKAEVKEEVKEERVTELTRERIKELKEKKEELTEEEKKLVYLKDIPKGEMEIVFEVFGVKPMTTDEDRYVALSESLSLEDCEKLWKLSKKRGLNKEIVEKFKDYVLSRMFY